MGSIKFLTGIGNYKTKTLEESIKSLKEASILFMNYWKEAELENAGIISEKAMVELDHIVNEILRKRDQLKTDNNFNGSALESHLNTDCGVELTSLLNTERDNFINSRPGNFSLPRTGNIIKYNKLINKIKHRRADKVNFKIGNNDEHIFYIIIDASMGQPDTIVEFDIADFCKSSKLVSTTI